MNSETLHARLGYLIITFQAIESAMVDLIVILTNSDPEYIATLTAELEFNAKARALSESTEVRFRTETGKECQNCSEFHQRRLQALRYFDI